jgi:hypothetical protein
MKRLLLALALLLIPATCCAQVLGSEVASGGSRMTGLDHRVRPFIGYAVGIPNPRLPFDDTWFDSTNVGTVLVATAATDTDFATVVARLTNGVSDVLCWGTCETVPISCAASFASEAAFFQMATPDFGPVTIERVTLELNGMYFRLNPVFQNPAPSRGIRRRQCGHLPPCPTSRQGPRIMPDANHDNRPPTQAAGPLLWRNAWPLAAWSA